MRLLNQTCVVKRATTTKDSYNNTTKSWVTVSSNTKCNIQYQTITSHDLEQNPTGLTISGEYLGFFDKDENIVKGDKVIWSGIDLFIKSIPCPVYRGNSIHHKEVLLSVEET